MLSGNGQLTCVLPPVTLTGPSCLLEAVTLSGGGAGITVARVPPGCVSGFPSLGQVLVGDVNSDGNVNAVDALCILRSVARLSATQACPVIPLCSSPPLPSSTTYSDLLSGSDGSAVRDRRILCTLQILPACPIIRVPVTIID
ncbi:MAG: hypothetical protein ACR2PL_18620 [Dehalococcoidia bacterium]